MTTSTTNTSLSDITANAVQAARAYTWRVEAGRCARQSATAFERDLLVTSLRALRGGEDLTVYDDAGAHASAELIGSDDGLDLAVLRVAGVQLATPQTIDHAQLRVGQLAIALGRPGVQIRASLRMLGLVGDEFRTPHGGRLDRYIESDRGLPDGFEGGALITESGALIGMNSSSLLRGADLTVPYATLARSVAELVAHGRVRRGYLGVACQPVRLPAALRTELSQRSGALVLDTEDGGPARAAGLTLGDVIVSLDGAPIRGPRELSTALRDKFGAEIKLGIVRNGQTQTLTLVVKERG
jgi:S1-C subfamily serine protease